MRFLPTQRVFAIVLVMTLALALLPAPALRWVNPLREIFNMVLTPFALLGGTVSDWVRPQPPPLEGVDITRDSLLHFQEQAARFEQLFVAEQARADELERQLQQLQNAPADMPRVSTTPLIARIALRPPIDPLGEVILNRGSSHQVTEGTVAVYNHLHLMGWVRSVDNLSCTLVPLANKQTRAFQGALFSKDRPAGAVSLANAPKLGLQPLGEGTFVSRPDRSLIVNVGDEIRLADQDWPKSAIGLHIGLVYSVAPDEKDPLRHVVVVRPVYQAAQVNIVVLRLESEDAR